MKFGHEYETALANEGFPPEWVHSAIQYKNLKKVIKKIHNELAALGLDADTLNQFSEWVEQPADSGTTNEERDPHVAAAPALTSIPEDLSPRLRILVDKNTGTPLDATLDPATKKSLRNLAQHESRVAGHQEFLGVGLNLPGRTGLSTNDPEDTSRSGSMATVISQQDTKWVTVPLASAKDFFDILEPKLMKLEALRDAESTLR